ncbi:MAG: argininosuccinate synthase [Planctomycetota bacterium]|nr:MAG: argininosuccinate synthase [Planctomycetota bacterium]
MQTVVLAFSGGLDTSYCAVWLREVRGLRVVSVCVDTGGFDAAAREGVRARALECGVAEHHHIDARAHVFDDYVVPLVHGEVLRGGVYPVSVAAERTAQVEAVVRVAREVGAVAIAHGSTGAGNDQVRFDVAIAALAPDLEVLAPIRELSLSREQEASWLIERGVPVSDDTVGYSLNAGLVGTTIGGRETHDSWALPPESVYTITCAPEAAPDVAEELVVGFEAGVPVSLDGVRLAGAALLEALNLRAGAHGVGRGLHVGDTILGVKGRIAFEAPAPLVLVQAHRELAKLVQTKWQNHWCRQLGEFYGMLLHEGLAFDPVMADLKAFLRSANQLLSGEVRVRLFKGAHTVVGVRSPHSLLDGKVAAYGEQASAWTGAEAAGFARIHGIPSLLVARRAQASAGTAGVTSHETPTHTGSMEAPA